MRRDASSTPGTLAHVSESEAGRNHSNARVTIVVVPRESYRCAIERVDRLIAEYGSGTRVIWVDDSRCPPRITRHIERRLAMIDGHLVRLPGRAGVNACRASGFARVETPYVLFNDNDTFLDSGALEKMIGCMDETGASFVIPVCNFPDRRVHHFGGETRIEIDARGRHLHEVTHHKFPPPIGPDGPQRTPVRSLEMHAVLVRTEELRAAGGFDTRLRSSLDCTDLSLRLSDVGGGGWLEPSASVTFQSPRVRIGDLPMYWARWSGRTVEEDCRSFIESWGLRSDDPRVDHHRTTLRDRRMRPVRYVRGGIRRSLGSGAVRHFDRVLDSAIDRFSDARVC
jgi:hypothetical protein